MPTGSPTFQRALKGLNTQSADCSSGETPSSAAAGKRTKCSSLAQNILTSKSRARPRLQFRDTVSYYHDSFSDGSDDDMRELQDRVSRLPLKDTQDLLNAVPSKSILKNRRRSIDDLDVGTKRGLADYLRSKQQEALSSNSRGYI